MSNQEPTAFSLRPMGLDDIERVAPWFDDFHDVALYESSLPIPVGVSVLRKRWKRTMNTGTPPESLWYVAVDPQGEPGGFCGLSAINYFHGDAVVPIFVGKELRGKGLAAAMSRALIDLAFDSLRLHRLTTFYREDNAATKAILAKFGFVEEGRRREAWFSEGTHKDLIQVGLLKTEWLENRDAVSGALTAPGRVSLTMRREV